MAKSKVTQKDETIQETAGFMNHVRNEVKKLEGCNFENFKQNMIAVIEQMYQAMLITVEYNSKERKDIAEFSVKEVDKVRAVNDEDFKKAERNFQHITNEIDNFEHRVSKAESGAMYCFLRVSALVVRLFKDGLISIDDVSDPEREFKLVPKKIMKCIAGVFGISQKSIRSMVKEVSRTQHEQINPTG